VKLRLRHRYAGVTGDPLRNAVKAFRQRMPGANLAEAAKRRRRKRTSNLEPVS